MVYLDTAGATVSALLLDPATDAAASTTGQAVITDRFTGSTLETMTGLESLAGRYTAAVTAATTGTLGPKRATFTAAGASAVVDFEVVGTLPVTRRHLRQPNAANPASNPFVDSTKWPVWVLDEKLAEAYEDLARMTGWSWVRRRTTETLGPGRRVAWPHRWNEPGSFGAFVSATIDGAAVPEETIANWTVNGAGQVVTARGSDTVIDRAPVVSGTTVTVTYFHGAALDQRQRDALLTLAKHRLLRTQSAQSERQERSFIDQNGQTVFVSQPSPTKTGLGDVDAVIHRSKRNWGIG
jgi:hypothetical protein